MQTLTVIFSIWVLAMAVRGYFRGFGKTLAGLLSIVGAYAASFVFAPVVTPMVEEWGVNKSYSLLVAGGALFLGVSLGLSLLAKMVLHFGFPGVVSQKSALAGALLGGALGVLIGFIAIWGYNLVQGTLNNEPVVTEVLNDGTVGKQSEAPSVVEQVSARFMGGVASLGAQAMGASDLQAELSSALAENPTVVVQGIQSISQSGQLKNLVNDPEATQAMQARDAKALSETPAFQAFMQQPAMQSLLDVAYPSVEDRADSNQYVAEKFSKLWRRMEVLKGDATVRDIMADPEVQEVIQSQNPMRIIANPKIKMLAARLLEGVDELDSVPSTEEISQKESRVYRWRDDKGQWHFTDYEQVPLDKRESARLISN